MKLLAIICLAAFIITSSFLAAAPAPVKSRCHCDNCQCTPEDHCGCFSNKGCKCSGDPSKMTKEEKRQCQRCNGGSANPNSKSDSSK